MLRIERAGAREAHDRIVGLTEHDQRQRAVVVRRPVAGIGRNRRIEIADGFAVPSLRGGDHAEVVGHRRVAGGKTERGAIERFRLGQAAFAMTRNRVGHERAKINAGHDDADIALARAIPSGRRTD